jgi:hypothetical protein
MGLLGDLLAAPFEIMADVGEIIADALEEL